MKIALTSLSNKISYCDMILFCTLWKDWQVPYLDMSIWEVSVGTGKKNDGVTIVLFLYPFTPDHVIFPFSATFYKVIRVYIACQCVFRFSTKKIAQ